jgi:hypothetical protein
MTNFRFRVPKQLTNPATVSTEDSYFTETCTLLKKIHAIFNLKTVCLAEFLRNIRHENDGIIFKNGLSKKLYIFSYPTIPMQIKFLWDYPFKLLSF